MFDIIDLDPELDWRPGDRIKLERAGNYHAVGHKPADVVEAVAAMRGAVGAENLIHPGHSHLDYRARRLVPTRTFSAGS